MFEHKISEYNETLLKLIYKCVRLVYSHITTIEDLLTQCDFYNELLFVCKGHNIPLNFKQFPTYFGDVHKLITVALCGLDEYTYKSNFKFDINTVKFMLFADGRNRATRALDTICFNKERTFDNTFYIDTDISAVPDSISDLTRVNKNLVYHGVDYPVESFEIISAKAAVYGHGSVFYRTNGELEMALFENLHRYLKPGVILELLRCDVVGKDLVGVAHMFEIKTVTEGLCYHLIKK